ncbi:MAG: PD-(D/E)XK nuclease family protein [Bacteroidales bacterium]|nr:PD-(D/E)XK nuclease family protein [Bacteroidales bacterium]
MEPFLRQVARHYHSGAGDISRLCFVFPNRRALRFFEHYLGQEIAASGGGPAVAPRMYTINDFFYHATGERPAGRVELLLEMYGCYKQLNPLAEPLDDFIFWGDTLLGDLDDTDKYLVNPGHLFANVSDLRNLQDDFSYLTETQRIAVQRFVRHFASPGKVKDSFLGIWRLLLPLYEAFRARLRSKGLSYEGMVYRELAESLQDGGVADLLGRRFPWSDRFVFVGLNALNECERTLLRRIHRAGLCEFCWDYRSGFIRDKDNKSSLFLRDFTVEFPQAFEPDPDGLPETEFNVLSVPGGIQQARQLPEILARCTPLPGIETAVVLPDEQMLIPVLNSIPENVDALNVTMGYPIGSSQMWALLGDLAALQLHIRMKDGAALFYHRQVWAVASNSIVRSVLSEEAAAVLERCRKARKFYIPREDLNGDPVLEILFRPVAVSPEPDPAQIRNICLWLQEILTTVAPLLKGVPDMQLELDFAKVCHEALEQMLRFDLDLAPSSFFRLLSQTVGTAAVPFEGEPLAGLQIMGPLELRALDFENLIILSFNEGMFPRRSVSSSFIPPELRKGFGLPTYEYQDAVWAYYFYRAIQRARRVWMVYDSRTEGLKGGEPSRYLHQLEMHFGVKVNHYETVTQLGMVQDDESIPKTAAHLETLRAGSMSASAIKDYLSCPVQFFYSKVEGLKAEDEISESLDARMLGNVVHKTMQELLPEGSVLDSGAIQAMRKDQETIRRMVDRHICEELKTIEITGRNIVFSEIICSYVDALLAADISSIPEGRKLHILGVEKFCQLKIGGFGFVGYIDRLDSYGPGVLRVVDYKTGRVEPADLEFDSKGKIPEIGLQLYLYKRLIAPYAKDVPVTGAIYQPARLMGGEGILEHALDPDFCARMEGAIDTLLAEISDLSVPWKRTSDTGRCKYCDFRTVCGR